MIIAVDVDYREGKAVAAGVLFQNWDDSEPVDELIAQISTVAEYEPGNSTSVSYHASWSF